MLLHREVWQLFSFLDWLWRFSNLGLRWASGKLKIFA